LETALYLPVKRFLEKLGFTVKGEVGGCDLVALSGGDPPIVVIGELKLSFNLELVLQAVDRAAACDEVWLAARMSARGKGRESDARYRNLCRRLGFGMLAVTSTGDVEVIVKPPTTSPRRDPKKRSRLVAEHRRRKGDPALGGSTRSPIMTAYRQQALACASALSQGPRRVRDLRPEIPDAPKILLHNVYGWFDRAERGIYRPDRCRTRRAETLAAAANRLCRRRRFNSIRGRNQNGGRTMIVVTGSVTAREDSLAEVRQLSLEHVHRSRKETGMHLARRACRLRESAAAGVHRAVGRSGGAVGAFRGAGLARFRPRAAPARRCSPTLELYDATRLESL
jgi:hypothetical protein